MCINHLKILLFLFVNILFLGGVKAQTANNAITLRNEKLNFIPGEFYIAGVADERTEKDIVATLVYKEGVAYKTRLADLKDGAANAIKLFITRNLSQNTDLRPVIVTLHDFKLAETDSGAGGVNGHLTMAISFGLRKDYGVLELVEYKSGLRYMRSYGQTEFPETILRHGIEGAIKWFNNWIEEYAQKDIRLAKSVSVAFSDYTEKPEGDTIYYAVNRPLAWDDFKDKPRAGVFDAEIFAGIGYTEHVEVEKGVIKLEIAVKVDMPKSGSWVKSNALDAYSLNHEQRHFDIAKIVGEHFKKKIAAMGVTPDNYEASISMEYLETLRELTSMQNQYDHDTHHGNDRRAQADWNTRIDEELKELGVK
jgi:hypothetical protein